MANDPMYKYSQWLFNRYVEAERSHNNYLRSPEYAGIMHHAIQAHLDQNLQGRKMGFARKCTKNLLKEIKLFKKNPTKFPLEYHGEEADHLNEKNERLRKLDIERWERQQDEHVSIVGDFTEIKTVKLAAKTVRSIAQFGALKATSLDDARICGAANLLLQVIRENGYQIADTQNSRILISKIERS